MPVELRLILIILLGVLFFSAFFVVFKSIEKNPKDWFFWKKEFWESIPDDE